LSKVKWFSFANDWANIADIFGVALRFMPGTSLFDRNLRPSAGKTGVNVSFATRPLWLLRGEDKTRQNDFSVGHRRA
jgi:hypothetical protein